VFIFSPPFQSLVPKSKIPPDQTFLSWKKVEVGLNPRQQLHSSVTWYENSVLLWDPCTFPQST
jgi:hypothetical protein